MKVSIALDSFSQAPLSVEFSRKEYWSGLPFSSPGDRPPIQGSNPGLLHYRQILYHLSHQGSAVAKGQIWYDFTQRQRVEQRLPAGGGSGNGEELLNGDCLSPSDDKVLEMESGEGCMAS